MKQLGIEGLRTRLTSKDLEDPAKTVFPEMIVLFGYCSIPLFLSTEKEKNLKLSSLCRYFQHLKVSVVSVDSRDSEGTCGLYEVQNSLICLAFSSS